MNPHLAEVKQLVVLSGKGGTGKTSISASLVHLASQAMDVAIIDADVDASNLSLVTQADPFEAHAFWGSQRAVIDQNRCSRCGRCFEVCRFSAIEPPGEGQNAFRVRDFLCEGCQACVHQCPEQAVGMQQHQDGRWFQSRTPYGRLMHAELFPGAENSGKLVTLVKQQAKLFAEDNRIPLMIIDGPPGIGCPVISASAGADLALLVAEPGVSGQHDLHRIIQTLSHFQVPMLVTINKVDIYEQGAREIARMARKNGCILGVNIPFDPSIPQAMIQAQSITKYSPDSLASSAVAALWEQIRKILF